MRAVPQPRVSVIVVAWRRAPIALRCLRSLSESAPAVPYEVLVVLNEPHPDLEADLEADLEKGPHGRPGATVLRSGANLGFAAAVNWAAKAARGELLALLNDDAVVEPGWLDGLVDAADRRPSAVAVGGLVRFPDGSIQEAGSVIWKDGWTNGVGRGLAGDDRRFFFERRLDYCSACSLLVRKDAFDRVGGLDESYYPAYFEDVDLCLRLAREGAEVWFTPLSRIRHAESTSTAPGYRAYLMELNHGRFLDRWQDWCSARLDREPTPAGIDRALLKAAGARFRVLVIDDRTPLGALGSGLARMHDTLAALVEDGDFLVTFLAGTEGGALEPDLLARLGVEMVDCDLVDYRGRLGDAVRDHLDDRPFTYDAVVVSRPHNYERYGEALRERLGATPIVYDAEAVYSRRLERQAALAVDRFDKVALDQELAAMVALESAIASEADAIVTICEEEAAFFRARTDRPVVVNPPHLAGSALTGAGFDERGGIVFVAGWGAGPTSPNADGLVWFVRHVLGGVLARVPGARLRVTGADPPGNVRRLAGPAVELLGGVDDLEDLYRSARVAVVPVRYGAGVKLKAVEALQHGVPAVATTVGAEGIPLDRPGALTVADDPEAFARAVAELLVDRDAWERRRRQIEEQVASWSTSPPGSLWPGLLRSVISKAR